MTRSLLFHKHSVMLQGQGCCGVPSMAHAPVTGQLAAVAGKDQQSPMLGTDPPLCCMSSASVVRFLDGEVWNLLVLQAATVDDLFVYDCKP